VGKEVKPGSNKPEFNPRPRTFFFFFFFLFLSSFSLFSL